MELLVNKACVEVALLGKWHRPCRHMHCCLQKYLHAFEYLNFGDICDGINFSGTKRRHLTFYEAFFFFPPFKNVLHGSSVLR